MSGVRIFPEHQTSITSKLHLNPNHLCRALTTMATSKGNKNLALRSLSLTAKPASVATVKAIPKAAPNAAKRGLLAGDKS